MHSYDSRSFRQADSHVWGSSANHVFLMIAVLAGCLSLVSCAKSVPVPDVRGQDLDQAKRALADTKLNLGTVSGGTGTGAYVVTQSPAAGQQVAANSKVDLVVKMPVQVPTLKDSNISDAVSMLQGLGLRVAFVKHPTINPFGKIKVEQQDPAPSSLVHDGAMVTLTMSAPPDIEALLGLVAQEPAYQSLKPEYKKVLDAFLGNPSVSRSMDAQDTPSSSGNPDK
jgi:beta-lactam-binding protein with PASTA domain